VPETVNGCSNTPDTFMPRIVSLRLTGVHRLSRWVPVHIARLCMRPWCSNMFNSMYTTRAYSSLPLPSPPGSGKNMLTSFVYFLHLSSPPHFFSAERSRGGTPEAYRRRTYEKTGERRARVRAGWGTAAKARRGGPAWRTTSPR